VLSLKEWRLMVGLLNRCPMNEIEQEWVNGIIEREQFFLQQRDGADPQRETPDGEVQGQKKG
jgi:hypothetical protein